MCPNEFPSIIKGLSRGRRVHRGHRDMPPARPPVVTEAPLSPWRALRRGEDPPPPPPAAGAQRFTHILSQKHVGSRAASVPGAAEEAPGRGGGCRVTGTETSTGSPAGDAPRGRLALVAREPPCGRGQTRGVFRGRRASSSSPSFPRGPAGGVSGRLCSPRHLNP